MPRSGLAINAGVTVINAPGLIDSGYRGPVKVALINHSDEPFRIEAGDRIAQLVVIAVQRPEYEVSGNLPDTARGSGGFGSTGQRGS
jgi:dUTP pyrophosphatase